MIKNRAAKLAAQVLAGRGEAKGSFPGQRGNAGDRQEAQETEQKAPKNPKSYGLLGLELGGMELAEPEEEELDAPYGALELMEIPPSDVGGGHEKEGRR